MSECGVAEQKNTKARKEIGRDCEREKNTKWVRKEVKKCVRARIHSQADVHDEEERATCNHPLMITLSEADEGLEGEGRMAR